jgi:2-polyprenyl-3-methyl-5-hydroxy-6-metoxy-1,4-benzoquinol methylase
MCTHASESRSPGSGEVQGVDPARTGAFAERMLQLVNDGFVALMTSVGHQTALFDTMSGMGPAPAAEIARAAELHERYVREWLGGMVVGGVVEYSPETESYRLPPEHAAVLTRSAGTDNIAALTQYLGLLAEVEQDVIRCFREGGGVPYSAYPRFQHLMAEDSGTVQEQALVPTTLPLVPGLVDRLRDGTDVLEIGCGQGHSTNLMAREFPASRFTAYDFSADGIAAANAEAERMGLRNVTFRTKDLATLDEPGSYDFILALDVIHDLALPRQVLRSVAAALRPGGWFLMVDIDASSRLERNVDHPLGPFLYAASLFHCMTVSLSQGGEGLGTVWGEEKARELLAEAELDLVDVVRIPDDITNAYYITRRAD